MKSNLRRNLIIAALGLLFLCCICGALFVAWANQPENVAASLATRTAEAYQNATQTAAAKTANAAATQEIAQIAKSSPVFSETFEENSAFLKQNIGSLSMTMNGGVPDVLLPFNADNIWPIGKQVKDFVAEVDCQAIGTGTYCGIAYGLHAKDQKPNSLFYASFTGAGGLCGFLDETGGFSTTKSWSCNPPESTAGGGLNRLRVERFGQHLRFYVNGQMMDDRVLSSPEASGGDVGLYFGRSSETSGGDTHVMFDNLKVWSLP